MNELPSGSGPSEGQDVRSARLYSADITIADAAPQRILVRDISARGCGARSNKTPPVGTRVSLSLPGVGRIEGTVGWVERGRFGIRFDDAIDVTKVLRTSKASSDFVVKDLHKPVVNSRRPGLGPKF